MSSVHRSRMTRNSRADGDSGFRLQDTPCHDARRLTEQPPASGQPSVRRESSAAKRWRKSPIASPVWTPSTWARSNAVGTRRRSRPRSASPTRWTHPSLICFGASERRHRAVSTARPGVVTWRPIKYGARALTHATTIVPGVCPKLRKCGPARLQSVSRASRRRSPTPDSAALGDALRGLRQDRGLKQIEVSHDAGISEAQLSEIERGVANPTWLLLTRIVRLGLKAEMTELIARYEEHRRTAG